MLCIMLPCHILGLVVEWPGWFAVRVSGYQGSSLQHAITLLSFAALLCHVLNACSEEHTDEV